MGEESIAVLCRREGIAESLFYSWSKEFLEVRSSNLCYPQQLQPALPVRPVWQAGCRSEGGRMRGQQRWIKLVYYHAVADNIFILFGYPAKRQLWIALFYFECEIPKNLR